MNTDGRRPRGMTLLEVTVALALLGVSALGLVGGMVVASNTNAVSRRRTHMLEFAHARLERIASRTRTTVPTAATVTPVNCSRMSAGGAFDPNSPPGTGGWMLDVIDGTPTPGGGALGDDLMAGPLLVETDSSGVDSAATLSQRATFASAWFAATDTAGCGSTTVTSDQRVMCREIHIEPLDVTVNGVTTFMLRVWVRVIQGGGPWQNSSVLMRQDIAQ
jgi:prepilin-type N-terminal cleavage/methylation domain-containing protein